MTTVPITHCAHQAHVPVEHVAPAALGNTTARAIDTVARLCINPGCWAQLPVAWGCPDCSWERLEMRMLCKTTPTLVLAALIRPCSTHEGGGAR